MKQNLQELGFVKTANPSIALGQKVLNYGKKTWDFAVNNPVKTSYGVTD